MVNSVKQRNVVCFIDIVSMVDLVELLDKLIGPELLGEQQVVWVVARSGFSLRMLGWRHLCDYRMLVEVVKEIKYLRR